MAAGRSNNGDATPDNQDMTVLVEKIEAEDTDSSFNLLLDDDDALENLDVKSLIEAIPASPEPPNLLFYDNYMQSLELIEDKKVEPNSPDRVTTDHDMLEKNRPYFYAKNGEIVPAFIKISMQDGRLFTAEKHQRVLPWRELKKLHFLFEGTRKQVTGKEKKAMQLIDNKLYIAGKEIIFDATRSPVSHLQRNVRLPKSASDKDSLDDNCWQPVERLSRIHAFFVPIPVPLNSPHSNQAKIDHVRKPR